MKKLEDYPKELIQNRNITESQFIFSLWKNPYQFGDYEKDIVPTQDFLYQDSIYYYGLGYAMYKKGIKSFDEVAVVTFIEENKILKDGFDNRGGMKTVRDITSIVSVENTESYFDELIKNNAVLQLHELGYDVKSEINTIQKMNYSQLEDYMEYKLNNVFLKTNSSGISSADLTSNYDTWIEEWNLGKGVGFKVGYPMLNYNLAGIHKKNLILHVGGIGQGKSTSALLMYVIPILESGEQITIIGNEQDEEQFRQMLLATILFNRIKNKKSKMNRQKLLFGNFTDDEINDLKSAAEYLEQFKGNLHFVHLTDYGTSNIRRVIKKYSKLGCEVFLVDTLKPYDESSDRAWAEFSETAKMLFQLAQKEDIAIIGTAQLASEASKRKYLDLSCIGKSRAIAETSSTVLLFRPLRQVEKENLEVYVYAKGTKVKEIVQLDRDKDYVVYFIAKNRYGAADVQIVYERNMSFNTMREIGYCEIDYDGFGK